MKIRSVTGTIAVLTMITLYKPALAQSGAAGSGGSDASVRWHSDKAVYVAGLGDVKPDSAGSLSLTEHSVAFVSKAATGEIPFDQITAVYLGDQRVATGGTTAKLARHIPIYGFGSAMGAITNKSVDLLTIEFQDNRGAYHGVVFEVPKTQAAIVQQQLSTLTSPQTVAAAQPCQGVGPSDSMMVAPITSTNVELPAEYRVLLYEQLIAQLQLLGGPAKIYRVGDFKSPCAAQTLQLSVTAFSKGNEAVRASTGPVGFFVGGTSVKFHVALTNASGTVLFEKSMKESKRGDGDSLSVTRDLGRSVSNHLKKAKLIATPEMS